MEVLNLTSPFASNFTSPSVPQFCPAISSALRDFCMKNEDFEAYCDETCKKVCRYVEKVAQYEKASRIPPRKQKKRRSKGLRSWLVDRVWFSVLLFIRFAMLVDASKGLYELFKSLFHKFRKDSSAEEIVEDGTLVWNHRSGSTGLIKVYTDPKGVPGSRKCVYLMATDHEFLQLAGTDGFVEFTWGVPRKVSTSYIPVGKRRPLKKIYFHEIWSTESTPPPIALSVSMTQLIYYGVSAVMAALGLLFISVFGSTKQAKYFIA